MYNNIENFNESCKSCSKYVNLCNKLNEDKEIYRKLSWAGGVMLVVGVIGTTQDPKSLVLAFAGGIILGVGLGIMKKKINKGDKDKNKIENDCGDMKYKCKDKIDSKGYKNVCSARDYVKK